MHLSNNLWSDLYPEKIVQIVRDVFLFLVISEVQLFSLSVHSVAGITQYTIWPADTKEQ